MAMCFNDLKFNAWQDKVFLPASCFQDKQSRKLINERQRFYPSIRVGFEKTVSRIFEQWTNFVLGSLVLDTNSFQNFTRTDGFSEAA